MKYMRLIITVFAMLLVNEGFAQRGEQMTIPEYINAYADLAQSEMRRSGIPASITLAQGILESKFGNSKLSTRANNHFGIKCGNNWDGQTFLQDDDERAECFRKYKSVQHSFIDHSNFLIGKDRYASLFQLAPTDYKGWAKGLQKAGYATNPNYANLLIKLIADRNLHQFDTEQKYQPLTKEEEEYLKSFDNKYFTFNGIKTVIAQPNELPLDIAYKYDIGLNSLLKYNDLKDTDIIPPGSKVYLQPKRRKGYEEYHLVEKGETMHSISQEQGIKLRSLYKKNRMEWGQAPAVGETLCLRKKCDEPPKLKSDEEIKKDIQNKINQRLEDVVKDEPVEKSQPTPASTKEEPTVMDEPEIEDPVIEAETAPVEEKEEPEIIAEETYEPEPEVEATSRVMTRKVPIFHRVAPKETLYGVSKMYGVTVDQIKGWNRMTDNSLSIGQELVVGYDTEEYSDSAPLKEDFPEDITPADPTDQVLLHTVRPKETLYGISRQYNVPVADIVKLNKLLSNEIKIGQVLKIPR